MAMPAKDITALIQAAIPDAHIDIEDYQGDEDHYRLTVASSVFAGKTKIQQHRLVYDALGGHSHMPIHALTLQTSPLPSHGENK